MSKIYFNEHQRKLLEMNQNVTSASDRAIQYSPEFKIRAIKENQAGKGPSQIFTENGFDLEMLGMERVKGALKNWRKTFQKYGEDGFLEERRGKESTGHPASQHLSAEKKLENAEIRIKYLEAENELLKKLEVLERKAIKPK